MQSPNRDTRRRAIRRIITAAVLICLGALVVYLVVTTHAQ
jgi:uncharacterized membrane protein YccC